MLASGYDIRSDQSLASVIDECVDEMGRERLVCIHVNDSAVPLGANRDRHAALPDGELGEQGISAFLSEPRFQELPALLEVMGQGVETDGAQVQLARDLRKRGLARRKRRAARR
jgi:deoxyribonuclease-4